jgi:voltage-gated potassium channel
MIIEDYTLLETFYQTVITISTVGFEEKEPFSDAGMIFTAIYIIFNLGIFAFAISSLTSYLFEGELNKVFNVYLTARELKNMENHVLFAVLDETEGRLLRS